MKIKDTELFAASVIQSSSAELSVEEKLKIFLEAKELAKKHNDGIKSPTASVQVFK